MILAGSQMFAPKKLRSLTGNHVFHIPSLTICGACFVASAVVSAGASLTSRTGTGAAGRPPARFARTWAIAVVVAGASSCRPSLDARAPITWPPRPLTNVADTGAPLTALAILASDAAIASGSATGHGSPSAPVRRRNQVRTVADL